MGNKYQTADHDFMHAKDYFNNYKFGYIERTTKTHMLQSLRPEERQQEDLLGILNESKKQLKQVKSVSHEVSKSIAELSELIYNTRRALEAGAEEYSNECRREDSLKAEYSKVVSTDENLRMYKELDQAFARGCSRIQGDVEKIDVLKKEIAMLGTQEAEEELRVLRTKREKLSGRQKRLSLITMENHLEDIHAWYTKATRLVQNIFRIRIMTIEQENNEMYLRFKLPLCEVGIFVRNGQMVDAKLYGSGDETLHLYFKTLRDFAVLTNNPRILLAMVGTAPSSPSGSGPARVPTPEEQIP
jgi:hypothetical protein